MAPCASRELGHHDTFSHRIAFLIGQQSYEDGRGFDRLQYPRADVKTMEKTLVMCGFNVIKYVDVEQDDFKGLQKLLAQNIKPNSLIALYYAGHALKHDGQGYLMPVDALLKSPKTWVSLNWFIQPINDAIREKDSMVTDFAKEKTGGEHSPQSLLLVVLDCCRVPPHEHVNPAHIKTYPMTMATERHRSDSNVVFLYACSEDASAIENPVHQHGNFTYAFTEAIKKGLPFTEVWERCHSLCLAVSDGFQQPWKYEGTTRLNGVELYPRSAPGAGDSPASSSGAMSTSPSAGPDLALDSEQLSSAGSDLPGGDWKDAPEGTQRGAASQRPSRELLVARSLREMEQDHLSPPQQVCDEGQSQQTGHSPSSETTTGSSSGNTTSRQSSRDSLSQSPGDAAGGDAAGVPGRAEAAYLYTAREDPDHPLLRGQGNNPPPPGLAAAPPPPPQPAQPPQPDPGGITERLLPPAEGSAREPRHRRRSLAIGAAALVALLACAALLQAGTAPSGAGGSLPRPTGATSDAAVPTLLREEARVEEVDWLTATASRPTPAAAAAQSPSLRGAGTRGYSTTTVSTTTTVWRIVLGEDDDVVPL